MVAETLSRWKAMTAPGDIDIPAAERSARRPPVGRGFPGRLVGGTALIAGPILLLSGVLLRLGVPFFFPDQLAAYAQHPVRMAVAYSLFAAGNVLLWPAVLVLVQAIEVRCPRWALWGGGLTMFGLFARAFSGGVDHLAFELVRVQGLGLATKAVADSYGAFHLFLVVALAKIPGWLALAVGAYRSGALPRWRAAALALMAALMGGTLKGGTPMSAVATFGLCAALVPLGVEVLRRGGDALPRPAGRAPRQPHRGT
jgi:hypothetical protein